MTHIHIYVYCRVAMKGVPLRGYLIGRVGRVGQVGQVGRRARLVASCGSWLWWLAVVAGCGSWLWWLPVVAG